MLTSTLSWTTGCTNRLVVLPADRTVVTLQAGRPFTPNQDGYFVPKARMLEILNELSERKAH